MTYHKNTVSLEKLLLQFLGETDPMLSMLEWLCDNHLAGGYRSFHLYPA